MSGWTSRYNPSFCKNNHLAEHDDIMFVQRFLADFELVICNTRQELLQKLSKSINELIISDFPKLVRILYRLDIPEPRLKQTLRENSHSDAGILIAELILDRQLQKLKTRQQTPPPQDIPDDEKW